MITDNFKDIIKHTSGLGFIDVVKLVGTESELNIETIDSDRNVVVTGQMKAPLAKLTGTVGIARLGILDKYLEFKGFNSKDALVSLEVETRAGEDIPSELKFTGSGHESHYRFMMKSTIDTQIKIPPFKGAKWDVTVKPTKAALTDFAYFSSAMSGVEPLFTVSTKGSNLVFNIGAGSNDRASLVFATNIEGSLKHAWSYPISYVLPVLKLMDSGNQCTLRVSDQGAMQITMDSGLGVYNYIFPARK